MSNIPSKGQILQWITDNPGKRSKRDIAQAFGIKGAARIDLKRILKELQEEGHLEKKGRIYRDPDKLPPVTILVVQAPDDNGDLFAKPLEWHGEGAEPRVLYAPRTADPAVGPGDRILAKVFEEDGEDVDYTARLIRKIGTTARTILGIYRKGSDGGRITPISKGSDREWVVREGDSLKARDGELVEGELAGPKARMGLPRARITARIGDPGAPRAVSLIAVHEHGIPDAFPAAVLAQADGAKPAGLKGREDFREMPLVTIDPADARDHDDACYAHADEDPKNPGGHVIWVAIADVAHYVTPSSALDREARKRGNSTYFPDRVVPMLPDRLSGDLCSLHEGVPRAVIAVRMVINAEGAKIGHSFHRGLMQSHASLHYEEAQKAQDGELSDKTRPLIESVIRPLFAAYESLKIERAKRQPLELDLPERTIVLDDEGTVTSVAFKDRLDAHRLIEEFMVLANVAAAETLIAKRTPLVFRVHEEPSPEKLDALREVAQASGLTLAKGQVLQTRHLNALLKAAEGGGQSELISISTLRSMQQAYYNPENFGHFGLALKSYAHFTSPIRRYADLVVHRALVTAHGWGKDGLQPEDVDRLEETAKLISSTERRSMVAERDTSDRYLAAYLADRVGAEFGGRISGIARFGVFVKLDETGADGLLPMRALGQEYFHYDAEAQTLKGSDTGVIISIGDRVQVKLAEAVPVTGGLILELLEHNGKAPAQGRKRHGKPPTRRKAGASKARKGKLRKKAARRGA